MSDSIAVEPVTVSEGEKEELFDMIDEIQSTRMTNKLKPSEIPSILMPSQIRWNADMSALRAAEKSRRVGFSWGCLAAEGALEASRQNGMNQYYMGYNMSMAAENIGDALKFAQAYNMACSEIDISRDREVIGDKKQDITKFRLRFASGFVYEALSSSPWSWRGRQGHARIDEAGFHQDLREVIKGAMAFLMWGGRVDVVSTHNSEECEFFEFIRDIKAGRLNRWSYHYIDIHQAINEGLFKRICLITGKKWSKQAEQEWLDELFEGYLTEEDALEELCCIPKKGSGAYFSRLLVEQCMIDGVPNVILEKPSEWVTDQNRIEETKKWIVDNLKPVIDNMTGHRTVYGQDFARKGDLSNTWLMQEREPNRWKQALDLELWNIPYDVQALIRDYLLDNVPLLHHASFDASGNGGSHAEAALQKENLGPEMVSCCELTSSFYVENFPKYRQAYEDRSYLIRRSEDIIADHRNVIIKNGRPTMSDKRIKDSNGRERHGDSAIAGLMCDHAIRQEGQAMETYKPMRVKFL